MSVGVGGFAAAVAPDSAAAAATAAATGLTGGGDDGGGAGMRLASAVAPPRLNLQQRLDCVRAEVADAKEDTSKAHDAASAAIATLEAVVQQASEGMADVKLSAYEFKRNVIANGCVWGEGDKGTAVHVGGYVSSCCSVPASRVTVATNADTCVLAQVPPSPPPLHPLSPQHEPSHGQDHGGARRDVLRGRAAEKVRRD